MEKTKKIFLRSISEGIIQLWRNKFLSIMTIGLGVLILILLNLVFSVQFFAEKSLQDIESRADFSIALRENFDAFEFEALQNDLQKFNVTSRVLEAHNFNDFLLPDRLYLQFHDISQVEKILQAVKNPRYSEIIAVWDTEGERDFVNIISKLLSLRENVEKAALVLIILFIIGGILLVINTFRLVIFSRKNEIFISRLVGADPEFIMGPFVSEGAFLGFIASFLSIIVFIFLLREITIFPGGSIFTYLWNKVFMWEILVAILVGMFGAWLSVRKYLFGKLQ
jgi:cell division transport system permease protein